MAFKFVSEFFRWLLRESKDARRSGGEPHAGKAPSEPESPSPDDTDVQETAREEVAPLSVEDAPTVPEPPTVGERVALESDAESIVAIREPADTAQEPATNSEQTRKQAPRTKRPKRRSTKRRRRAA